MTSSPEDDAVAPMEDVARFVIRTASMAHQYGTPSYVLESALPRLTHALGYRGLFMAQPRNLSYTFWRPQEPQPLDSAFVELPPVTYSMDKLNHVTATIASVAAGDLSMAAASEALDQVATRRSPYPEAAQALAFALTAAGFAVLLNASWGDVVAGAVLGAGVWALTRWIVRLRWAVSPHRVELSAAFIATCAANLLALALHGSNPSTVALCSFIILIPGLPLTLGVLELTEGHTLAGLNRLTDGVVSTVSLFAGAAVASLLFGALADIAPAAAVAPRPAGVIWLFVAALMLGLTVVFRVVPRNLAWCVAGGVVGYAGVSVGGQLGSWQGPFLGAAALGIYASLIGRLSRHMTPLTVALPGILVLVPGAAAYLTLSTFEPDSPLANLAAVLGVGTQIVAIVAGLSFATLFLPSRSASRTEPAPKDGTPTTPAGP